MLGCYGTKTVVCGAPNCRPGVTTLWLPIGRKVIHGVESDGMLAAGSKPASIATMRAFMELDAPAGFPPPGCVPDSIIEIDNKSITHRPDLWGHHRHGARSGRHCGQKACSNRPISSCCRKAHPPVNIQVENPELCPQYCALAIEGIQVKPSPPWLQYRLTSIGLNPINNIVDLTNFVMAELAQPMHAFDADRLHGDTIFVRPARPGERFRALNEEEYTLGAFQPGDCRRGRGHRPGRRDRRPR